MDKPKAKKTTDSAQTPDVENHPGLPPKPKGRPSAALKSRWLVVVAAKKGAKWQAINIAKKTPPRKTKTQQQQQTLKHNTRTI